MMKWLRLASFVGRLQLNGVLSYQAPTIGISTQIRSAVTLDDSDNPWKPVNRKRRSEAFPERHIGPNHTQTHEMLKECGLKSLDELMEQIVPNEIRLSRHDLNLDPPVSEQEFLRLVNTLSKQNQTWRSYIGAGYYGCITPTTITRNVFENPGWTTSYTPYQAELSQGRMESLFNYQTMVCDLTGLEVANASLLDEGTAAAEAMALCKRQIRVSKRNLFYVDSRLHPQTIDVIKTRAAGMKIHVVVADYHDFDCSNERMFGVIVQYPDTEGNVNNYATLVNEVHAAKSLAICATDLLALTLIKPPGEIGFDVAVGSSQRFGIPLGYGGPHAAFFASRNAYVRNMPGRIIGLTRDAYGEPAYRLALQTREQHIRREKATSNICTAQALLANMSVLYAIYHGAMGLIRISQRVHYATKVLRKACVEQGHEIVNDTFFDTLTIKPSPRTTVDIRRKAAEKQINLRYYKNGNIGVTIDETVTRDDFRDILDIFNCPPPPKQQPPIPDGVPYSLKRTKPFLQQTVFQQYRSEANIVRYMRHLERVDYSLGVGMIPLGSCTMKLNSTTEMMPCSWREFNDLHPFAPPEQALGYAKLISELNYYLCQITGYDAFSFQPNSGAQGEYAGLRAIMAYLTDQGEPQRNVCLIPVSAHGTNAASAQMAGMKVRSVPENRKGALDMKHFRDECIKYKDTLAAVMITYPSTFGIFDEGIKEVCDTVHEFGGQVYLDGANLNAQVGLCRPGDYGADVSHLNLHKTFCIPHGGGGPGVGPIGVKIHLADFLPTHPWLLEHEKPCKSFGTVSAAPYGSTSILPISWAYLRMMGPKGLRKATEIALLNANYMLVKLKPHYPIAYTNHNGRCGHEFILECREFKHTANVDVIDIAKRLQDYGCHAPTVSFPVQTGLMIEPTESEDKTEIDRLCNALISIRDEIKDIEEGRMNKNVNPLKMAPHSLKMVAMDEWRFPYSRTKAAFPAEHILYEKFWPRVARVDDVYGDQNLNLRRTS